MTRIENTVFLRKTISLNSPRSRGKMLVSTRNRVKEKEIKKKKEEEKENEKNKKKKMDKKISSRAFLTDSPRDGCLLLVIKRHGRKRRLARRDSIFQPEVPLSPRTIIPRVFQ